MYFSPITSLGQGARAGYGSVRGRLYLTSWFNEGPQASLARAEHQLVQESGDGTSKALSVLQGHLQLGQLEV